MITPITKKVYHKPEIDYNELSAKLCGVGLFTNEEYDDHLYYLTSTSTKEIWDIEHDARCQDIFCEKFHLSSDWSQKNKLWICWNPNGEYYLYGDTRKKAIYNCIKAICDWGVSDD